MTYVTPIIFSTDMVLALLAGRKTQTRRLITSQWANLKMHHDLGEKCWLYVRESWNPNQWDMDRTPTDPPEFCPYKADMKGTAALKWKPSIHMPRKVSRLSLKIADVRKQKLQDISRADAIDEGLKLVSEEIEQFFRWPHPHDQQVWLSPVAAYETLWNRLHTKPGTTWRDNPDIYAITFEVHQGNIDTILKEAA